MRARAAGGTFSDQTKGAVFGLAAAGLFGLSTPFAKELVPEVGPIMLAALLYLGAGLVLTVAGLVPATRRREEAPLRRSDLPWLFGIVVLGGITGPVLMLYGLGRMTAVAGSLLLNLEAPLTILIALLFREHAGWRLWAAAGLVTLGALLLGGGPSEAQADWLGILAILGACASWALDNNFTQRLSLRNPLTVVRIKAFGAGACTLVIAWATGSALPSGGVAGLALMLGAASYGLSVLFDMYALRLLGAAREATYFATAPFIGAVASVPLLGEPVGLNELLAGGLMATGVVLLLRERHGHLHSHDEMSHEHLHVHDEHHQHAHDNSAANGEPHSHPHRHAPIAHDHPHVPDLHHRHRH